MATDGARKDKEEAAPASSPLGGRHLDVVHEGSPAQREKDEKELSAKMSTLSLDDKKDKKRSDKKAESSRRKDKIKPKDAAPPQPSDDHPPLEDALTQAAKAKSAQERKQALQEVLVQVDKADRQETQSGDELHRQNVQVGRIHNNLDRTDQNLAGAEDELHQTRSCGYAVLCCLFGWCKCCKPKEPHHDQEMEERHPAPKPNDAPPPTLLMSDASKAATSSSAAPVVAVAPATGKQPTEKEQRQAILATLRHQEGTLGGEISELKDANAELGQMVAETDRIKERTKDDAAKAQSFVKANKM